MLVQGYFLKVGKLNKNKYKEEIQWKSGSEQEATRLKGAK
jgi:hypothetical protein